jgi:DNA-binding NarL/FixJ family response regulator
MDSRFTLAGVAASAEEALKSLRTAEPEVIVLDHGLSGHLTGLDAAPRLKDLAPQAKIIMFTAHAELRARAEHEPAVDGFVLKAESHSCCRWLNDWQAWTCNPPEVLAPLPTSR